MKTIHKLLLGLALVTTLAMATPAQAYGRHRGYVYHHGYYGYYYGPRFYPYYAGPRPYYYGPYNGPGVVVGVPGPVVVHRHHFFFFF